jgi:hypothetical protein
MHKVVRMAALLAMLHITPVHAAEYIMAHIPNPQPVGTARLSIFMMDIYDATLLAQGGKWQPGDPLALQLRYLRELKGNKIADRSVEEMRSIGITDEVKLAAWHTQMRRIFPDVREGMTLTGILTPKGESIFLRDGQEIGRIIDPDFGKAFFGIWLSEKTSAPDLRQKLLGSS